MAGVGSPRSPGEHLSPTRPPLHVTGSSHYNFLPPSPNLRQVNLNELAKKLGLGSGNLRFADEAIMLEKLKVRTCH